MTPQKTALINTLKLIGGTILCILLGVIISLLLPLFSITQIGIGFSVIMLIAMIRFVYLTELEQAQSLDRLNNYLTEQKLKNEKE